MPNRGAMSFHTGIGMASKLRAGTNRPAGDSSVDTSDLKYSKRAPRLTVRRLSVQASWAKTTISTFKRLFTSNGVLYTITESGTPFLYRWTRSAFPVRVRRYRPEVHCAPALRL